MQDVSQIRTTCVLQDITPGIYTIEVNTTLLACFFFFWTIELTATVCRSEQNLGFFLSPLAEG